MKKQNMKNRGGNGKKKVGRLKRTLVTAGLFVCACMMVGCKKEVEELTDANGRKVELFSFDLTVYDQLKDQGMNDYLSRVFGPGKNGEYLSVFSTDASHAMPEANVKNYLSILAGEYDIPADSIKKIDADEGEFRYSWDYKKDGKDYSAECHAIYEEDTMLYLTLAAPAEKKDVIDGELEQMAATVNYTGDRVYPEEENYPYSVSTKDFKVTVQKGYYCIQGRGPEAANANIQLEQENEEGLTVRYVKTDDLMRGGSYFHLEETDNQHNSPEELAKGLCKYSDGKKIKRNMKESSVGELWPEIKEDEMRGIRTYQVFSDAENSDFMIESIFFRVNDKNMEIGLVYPKNDPTAREDMMSQFYGVEFLK